MRVRRRLIAIEAALGRERAVIGAGLAVLAALTWVYLWQGAGMGMSALDMTTLSLFPHRQAEVMGEMDSSWPIVVIMWWVMMIAMMTPSVAPLVLQHPLVLRRNAALDQITYLLSLQLLAGYLLAWLGFSVGAAALQKVLLSAELLSPMMLSSNSAVLSAALLAAAGLYQLSSFKQSCLAQCRSPVRFQTEPWRPGPFGAVVFGVRYGACCVGCCWTLMALLFVGGVMNLIWIAMLTLIVAVERFAPAGATVGKFSGVLLVVWAGATLFA